MNSSLKSLVTRIGRLLLVVALVFVGLKLHSHWSGISSWRPDIAQASSLFILSVFYGSMLFLLAEAWHRIVNIFGPAPRSQTYPSFTMTQVAKYIPGNIAHLVGRGLYLRGHNLSDTQIVKATLVELMAIPAGAVILVVLLGSSGQLAAVVPHVSRPLWLACVLTVIATFLVASSVSRRMGGDNPRVFKNLMVCIGLAMAFMAGLGLVFAGVFHILAPAPVVPLVGSAVIAWLIGFLTPGAPGGVGIREAMLITLLWGFDQDTVLIAAILFRVLTTLGDVIILVAGRLIFKGIRPTGSR